MTNGPMHIGIGGSTIKYGGTLERHLITTLGLGRYCVGRVQCVTFTREDAFEESSCVYAM